MKALVLIRSSVVDGIVADSHEQHRTVHPGWFSAPVLECYMFK